MTDRSRVAITLMTTLALGASTYGHAYDISPPGVLQDVWDDSYWVIYGLAIVGVFMVNRWWALLPAVAPVAVTICLHSMTDYVPPWREEENPSLTPWFFLLVIEGVAVHAAFLSVGLLLRAAWERVSSWRRKGSLPDSA